MMMNTTLNQLRSLRLETMAQALEQQLQTSGMTAMSFEERLGLLVDREVHGRQDRRCARLLKLVKLKYPQAAIEDLDSRTRGIERSAVMSLALDDWGMTAMDAQTRADLLEIIDDRANTKATIITSQLPIEHWHEWIGDATIADAMLDRLMQNNHRFTLTGESMRKKTVTKVKTSAAAINPEGA